MDLRYFCLQGDRLPAIHEEWYLIGWESDPEDSICYVILSLWNQGSKLCSVYQNIKYSISYSDWPRYMTINSDTRFDWVSYLSAIRGTTLPRSSSLAFPCTTWIGGSVVCYPKFDRAVPNIKYYRTRFFRPRKQNRTPPWPFVKPVNNLLTNKPTQ